MQKKTKPLLAQALDEIAAARRILPPEAVETDPEVVARRIVQRERLRAQARQLRERD